MTDRIEQEQENWSRKLRWYVVISLLLHILILLFFGAATNFEFFEATAEAEERNQDIVFELAETPAESNTETPPEDAKLYSDKDMRAQNPEQTPDVADVPFNPGDIEFPEMPTPPTAEGEESIAAESQPDQKEKIDEIPETTREEFAYEPVSRREFSRDLLLGKQPSTPATRSRPSFNNREFSVEDLGGFAFNTYNWNFAPYMIYLKKRIEKHIFPPPAFTRMGIIEGRFVLRFLISRDGTLLKMKVLNTDGHSSLLETSRNAVQISAPFRSLPRDFPEDFLEVTGTFVYTVGR